MSYGGMTPYDRGYAAGLAGEPGPAFPTSQSSWAEKLFNRGWIDGIALRDRGRRLGRSAERAAREHRVHPGDLVGQVSGD